MSFAVSRSGIRADLQANLPFTRSVALRFSIGTGIPDAPDEALAFEIAENTHLWLVYCATLLIEAEGKAGGRVYDLIQPWQDASLRGDVNQAFHDSLARGLWDADYKYPYNGRLFKMIPTWRSHFYDPDTRTNWMGQTTPTALSEGCRYYDASLDAYRRGDTEGAGYALGLALHYLTDLTQPMHAANFTWLDSHSFGFHNDFESYAKAVLHTITPPDTYAPLINAVQPATYFHAVARASKDNYYAAVCRPEWSRQYDEAARDEGVWEQRVGGVLPLILCDAVQITAQFLLMWSKDTHSPT